MPIRRNQAFLALALLTGLAYALMGIIGVPDNAYAITAVVVGALYAFGAIFWKENPTPTKPTDPTDPNTSH